MFQLRTTAVIKQIGCHYCDILMSNIGEHGFLHSIIRASIKQMYLLVLRSGRGHPYRSPMALYELRSPQGM